MKTDIVQREPQSDGLMNDSNAERTLRKFKGFANSVSNPLLHSLSIAGPVRPLCALCPLW